MTDLERWQRDAKHDPISAYLAGFYSWLMLATVIAGMLAMLWVGYPIARDFMRMALK